MPLVRRDATARGETDAATEKGAAALLADGTREQRWSAARALADDPEGGPALAAALAGEADALVREAILTGLVRHAGDASVNAILPLVRSDDAGVRAGALDSLRAMPEAIAPRLPGLLADPDADVRLLACDLVRVLPPAEASKILCDLLDREDVINVCAAAIDAIAEVGGPQAADALKRCATRFAGELFLSFAIRAALSRIGATTPDPRG